MICGELLGHRQELSHLGQKFALARSLLNFASKIRKNIKCQMSHVCIIMALFTSTIHFAAHADINDDLLKAAERGQTKLVENLLSDGADVNATNSYDQTSLILAANNGRKEIVQILLEAGADVISVDQYGHPALAYASRKGHAEIERLIRYHTVDRVDEQLLEAVRHVLTSKVQEILNDGANVNAKDNIGTTALLWASRECHIKLLRILLGAGADVNAGYNSNTAKNWQGVTALIFAVGRGQTEIVKFLLDSGADMNAQTDEGWTPLLIAANEGKTELVKILLDAGADSNKENESGRTAIECADVKGYTEIVKLLVKAVKREVYQLSVPGHGSLELRIPTRWAREARYPAAELPPTLRLVPPDGNSLALLTVLWEASGDSKLGTLESLRPVVEQMRDKIQGKAVESELPIRELKGESVVGLCYSATDKAPSPTGYRYLTQGIARSGDLLINFTVLTRRKESHVVTLALEMVAGASHLPVKK